MLEARTVAAEHTHALLDSMRHTRDLATEIGGAGGNYPAGIRDAAVKLAADLQARIATIETIGRLSP